MKITAIVSFIFQTRSQKLMRMMRSAVSDIFSFVSEGEYLVINGRETVHKSYGPQIQVESYESKRPSSQVAIEKYLGSGAIKGIGAALAARIVRRFGEKLLRL